MPVWHGLFKVNHVYINLIRSSKKSDNQAVEATRCILATFQKYLNNTERLCLYCSSTSFAFSTNDSKFIFKKRFEITDDKDIYLDPLPVNALKILRISVLCMHVDSFLFQLSRKICETF